MNFFKVLLLFITFKRRRNMAEILPKMRKTPFNYFQADMKERNINNQFKYVDCVNTLVKINFIEERQS